MKARYGMSVVSLNSNFHSAVVIAVPDSKVHGANLGTIWGRQDPGGPHVGPMNLGIWGDIMMKLTML